MKINDKDVPLTIGGDVIHCPIGIAMNFIGGKWKTTILWYLRDGSKRFGEIRKLIPPITERVLSITLQQLEKDGLIIKTVYHSKPPLKVDYELTPLGRTFIPILEGISAWGFDYGRKIGLEI